MAPNPIYQQVSTDRYKILRDRYERFLRNINNPNKEVVRIFDTLGPQQQEELKLIRSVTMELQEKKEEDMRKAAQAAEEASKAEAEKAKEEAESKVEEKEEEREKIEEIATEQETAEKVEN